MRMFLDISIQSEEAAVPLPWQQSHPQGVQDPGATQEPEASTRLHDSYAGMVFYHLGGTLKSLNV
jgi:hypothetical protein